MKDDKLLIVNADDFGISPEANNAIVQAHRDGIVTSATIMANMPGFCDAIELARDCPNLGIGLHVNLTDGRPISDPYSKLPGLFGLMVSAWWSKSAMRREICAQLETALASGIKITHLDSHKHVHVHPMVLSALVWAANKYSVKALRVPIESRELRFGEPIGWQLRSALVSFNAQRVRQVAIGEDFFATDNFIGTAKTCRWSAKTMAAAIKNLKVGITELMVHPNDLDALISDDVRHALDSSGAQLITYDFKV